MKTTNKIEHTPTPWELVRQGNQGDYVIVGDYTKIVRPAVKGGTVADIQRDLANAEFIVRAVNSHDDLLTALKALYAEMLMTDHAFSPNMVLAKKAIAQAEGK